MDQKPAMIRTALAAALLLALAACGENGQAPEEQGAGPAAASAEKIECAVGGSTAFAADCAVERTDSPEGATLTLRAPDGSFRRLLVTTDGRGVVAADGAEPAAVTPLSGNRIEVAIGGDRYRLPATVKQ